MADLSYSIRESVLTAGSLSHPWISSSIVRIAVLERAGRMAAQQRRNVIVMCVRYGICDWRGCVRHGLGDFGGCYSHRIRVVISLGASVIVRP